MPEEQEIAGRSPLAPANKSAAQAAATRPTKATPPEPRARKVRLKAEAVRKSNSAINGLSSATSNFERHAMIAEAAYYRAEKRGFACGCELQDWLAAEIYIDRLLNT